MNTVTLSGWSITEVKPQFGGKYISFIMAVPRPYKLINYKNQKYDFLPIRVYGEKAAVHAAKVVTKGTPLIVTGFVARDAVKKEKNGKTSYLYYDFISAERWEIPKGFTLEKPVSQEEEVTPGEELNEFIPDGVEILDDIELDLPYR